MALCEFFAWMEKEVGWSYLKRSILYCIIAFCNRICGTSYDVHAHSQLVLFFQLAIFENTPQ